MAGLAHDELFDVTPVTEAVTKFFYGNPDYSICRASTRSPISACAHRAQRTGDQLHRTRRRDPTTGASPASAVPRRRRAVAGAAGLARDLGVFVPESSEAMRVLVGAMLDARKERPEATASSRVKARIEVHDRRHRARRNAGAHRGPRSASSAGRTLRGGLRCRRPTDHMGIQAQKQDAAFVSIGVPVKLGLTDRRAQAARRRRPRRPTSASDVRLTSQQELIVAHLHRDGRRRVEVGTRPDDARALPLTGNPATRKVARLHGRAALRNFAVTETKSRLGRPSRAPGGPASATRSAASKLKLNGCPHPCGHHWMADLGFQGTTARRRRQASGRQAYDLLRCAAASAPTRADRPALLFRRVPSEELDDSGRPASWTQDEGDAPTARRASVQFSRRQWSDEELGAPRGGRPARGRTGKSGKA